MTKQKQCTGADVNALMDINLQQKKKLWCQKLNVRRNKMLETIAWAVMLMFLGAVIVVIVGVAIFMMSGDD
jgi:hypothetical protein